MRQCTGSKLAQVMVCCLFGAWAIAGNNADLLSSGPLGTNFGKILIKIQSFSVMEMYLNMSFVQWWPFFQA